MNVNNRPRSHSEPARPGRQSQSTPSLPQPASTTSPGERESTQASSQPAQVVRQAVERKRATKGKTKGKGRERAVAEQPVGQKSGRRRIDPPPSGRPNRQPKPLTFGGSAPAHAAHTACARDASKSVREAIDALVGGLRQMLNACLQSDSLETLLREDTPLVAGIVRFLAEHSPPDFRVAALADTVTKACLTFKVPEDWDGQFNDALVLTTQFKKAGVIANKVVQSLLGGFTGEQIAASLRQRLSPACATLMQELKLACDEAQKKAGHDAPHLWDRVFEAIFMLRIVQAAMQPRLKANPQDIVVWIVLRGLRRPDSPTHNALQPRMKLFVQEFGQNIQVARNILRDQIAANPQSPATASASRSAPARTKPKLERTKALPDLATSAGVTRRPMRLVPEKPEPLDSPQSGKQDSSTSSTSSQHDAG